MDTPLRHQRTEEQWRTFLKRPSHGLLLTGPEGSGKYYVAQWLAQQLSQLQETIQPLDDKKLISIDQIIELYQRTQTGSSLTIIIKDSHLLSIEAQNAFLKLLEEPPHNTYFIITSHSPQLLLPTIRSRVHTIDILPPDEVELLRALPEDTALNERELVKLAKSLSGLPGAYFQLLGAADDRQEHFSTLETAKQFYSEKPYNRLHILNEKNYDREWAGILLQALATITESLLKIQSGSKLPRLVKQAELIEKTYQNTLRHNGNPKIHLTNLALNL